MVIFSSKDKYQKTFYDTLFIVFEWFQVDLVSERVDIKGKITTLMSEDFPELVLQNQVKPVKKGTARIEICFVFLKIIILEERLCLSAPRLKRHYREYCNLYY